MGVAERSGLPDDKIRSFTFPGGRYTIAHWENYLLTDCTTSPQLADGLAHPVNLFHVSILGAGVDITEPPARHASAAADCCLTKK